MSKIYLPNATQLDTLNEKLGALNDTLGDSGTIQDVQAIDPNGSVCDNFVIPHTGVPKWGMNLFWLADRLQLENTNVYIDPIETLKTQMASYSKYYELVYYEDIHQAVTDINNDTATNGSTTATTTGVKVFHLKDADGGSWTSLWVMQLLSDITLTSAIDFTRNCFIDFNGFKIKGELSTSMPFPICANQSRAYEKMNTGLMFYGVKEGSGTEFTCAADADFSKTGMSVFYFVVGLCKFIGGTYTLKADVDVVEGRQVCLVNSQGTNANSAYQYNNNDSYYEFQGTTFHTEITKAPTYDFDSIYIYPSAGSSYVKMEQMNLTQDMGSLVSEKAWSYGVMVVQTWGQVVAEIIDTEIESTSGSSSDIQASYAMRFAGDYISIRNSHFKSSNCGLGGTWHGCYISNCILEGKEHGGIYCSNRNGAINVPSYTISRVVVPETKRRDEYIGTYIQNTTLRKLDGTGGAHNNLYSCYFGYGSITYCNNVTFDSYNGAYNRPALKTGENTSSYASKTRAYFSNCNMTSIRVDAGCEAIFGAGIDDSLRTASVDGTITNKPTEIYSSVVSHEMGGLNQRMMDRIRGLEEDNEKVSAKVTKSGDTATITITDKSGTTTAEVVDGSDAEVTKDNVVAALGYEPASGKYELLKTLATEAEAEMIVINKDEDGQLFEATRLIALIILPAETTKEVTILTGVRGYRWTGNSSASSGTKSITAIIDWCGDGFFSGEQMYSPYAPNVTATPQNKYWSTSGIKQYTDMTKLDTFATYNFDKFPTNTTIYLYGIRA